MAETAIWGHWIVRTIWDKETWERKVDCSYPEVNDLPVHYSYPEVHGLSYTTAILRSLTYHTLQLSWGQWPVVVIVHYSYPEVNDLSYTTGILRSMTYRTLQLSSGKRPLVHYSYPEVHDLSYTTAILRSMSYRTLQVSLDDWPVMHDDEPKVKPLCQVHQMVCLLSENAKACLKINTNIFVLSPGYVSAQRKCCIREQMRILQADARIV